MHPLAIKIIIVSIIDIVATDTAFFYKARRNPKLLSTPYLVALILITLLPIMIAILVWTLQHPGAG